MSRYIATRAIRGANALVTEAELMLKKALAEKGPETPVAFPNTAYYLPVIYGMTGHEVTKIGDLQPVLEHARALLHPAPAQRKWTPYLGEALDSGMATLLAAEAIEAIRFVYGLQPEPFPGIELAGGTAYGGNGSGNVGHLNGPIDDIQLRSWGIQLVDGRMPGFAAIVGAAKSNEVAVKIVRELQRRNILCFLSGNVNGRSIIHQLVEEGIELGYDTYTVPFGTDTISAIYALGFATRSALTFGGIKPGNARDILLYNKQRVFAFVLALGEVDDLKYAAAAGAINYGFPVIADTVIPEILPTGITTYEHVVSMPFNEIEARDDLERAEILVQKCIEVRGVKIKVAEVPVPVPYGSAFEGEVVRKADMRIEFGGKYSRCFEYLRMVDMDEVQDGKVEVVGSGFDEIKPQGHMDLGIVIEVAGRKMQKDFEPVLERQVHYFINGASGVQHIGQRDITWIRISNAAAEKGFNLEHFGKILHARYHADFGAIVDKVQVTLYTDKAEIEKWLARAREAYDYRNKRLADLTDTAVDEFFSCTLCQSFAPDHVCIVSPERLGLCGAYNWLDCKASYSINPTGPNQPIKLGACLDPVKGYWEGTNEYAAIGSHGTVQKVAMYSIMENPMTACLTSDAEVIIDGCLTTIGEWVNAHYGQLGPFDSAATTLDDQGQITPSRVLGVHRNPAPPFLVELETKSGQRLTLTPNHPLAVDRPEGQVWVRADEVQVNDRLYAARHVKVQEHTPLALDLLPDDWRVADDVLIAEAWAKLEGAYGSKAAARRALPELPDARSSWSLALYREVCEGLGQDWSTIKTRIRRVAPPAGRPAQLLPEITPDLLYLLGFLASDGSLNRTGKGQCQVFFTNAEPALLSHVQTVYERVFPDKSLGWRGKTHSSRIGTRTITPTRTGRELYGSNALLGALADALGIRRADSPTWDLRRLFTLPEAHIAAFIAGVFDGDGSVRVRDQRGWIVGEAYLCHSDERAARHMALLLRRLGVVAHLSEGPIYRLIMHGADLRQFASLVHSHHPARAEKLAILKAENAAELDKSQSEVLPYAVGQVLAQADAAGTLSTSTRYSYATGRSRPVGGNVARVLEAQPDMVSTLPPWLERDDFLDTVTRVEMIRNDDRYGHVYNLSLLDINSYLANGLLVKNCGCFECIVMYIPEANGVMVVSREDTSMTPAGMTFSTLAGMAGGGLQTPGVMGVGKYYLISPKFISADGGLKRVVWMSSILKETMAEELRAAAEREGVPDLIDKIADERKVTDVDELVAWLEEHNHPALAMPPMGAEAVAEPEAVPAQAMAHPEAVLDSLDEVLAAAPSRPAPAPESEPVAAPAPVEAEPVAPEPVETPVESMATIIPELTQPAAPSGEAAQPEIPAPAQPAAPPTPAALGDAAAAFFDQLRRALAAGLLAAARELGADVSGVLPPAPPAPPKAAAPTPPAPPNMPPAPAAAEPVAQAAPAVEVKAEAPAPPKPAAPPKKALPPDKPWLTAETKTEIVKEKWTGRVREVTLGANKEQGGTRARTLTLGGQTALPFMFFEGEIPHRPAVAIEIMDRRPADWSPLLLKAWGEVVDDPAAWARVAENAGADALVLALTLTDPDGKPNTPERAVAITKAVLQATGLPLIVWGPGQAEADNALLVPIAEATKGERLALGICEDKNYRTIVATALANDHVVIARTAMDVNLAKQLNILISDMGLPLDRVLMDPTTGALGYGIEYGYSVMERLRLAALQGDAMTQLPMIVTPGYEAWKAKESKVGAGVPEAWGDWEARAIHWETLTAMALIESAADLVVLRHPESVRRVRLAIDDLMSAK